ncbi:MAG: hypothetical protein HC898_05275 [Phycisphaerales bacterium]|nr:hypothetical protein [Phycisphaerales bacterium]
MPMIMLSDNPVSIPDAGKRRCAGAGVKPGIEVLTLVQARVEQTQLKPGQTVIIQLVLQPFGKPRFTRRVEFPLPANLPDGSYQLMLGDASTYHSQMMDLRPHRSQLQRIEDVLQSLQELATLRDDALYLSMTVPGEGLAVGRTELPLLPSSRRAMLTAPSGTSVSPMGSWTQKIIPMEAVVQGSLMLAIQVKKETPAR